MLPSLRAFLRARLDHHVRRAMYEVSHDLGYEAQVIARHESALWAREQLGRSRAFTTREALLDYCLGERPRGGAICEFGVFSGRTINRIARLVDPSPVHGFDSFEGLPEDWRLGFDRRTFSTSGVPPRVAANVVLHAGWFDDTIPPFRLQIPGPMAFVHVDCDLYSSTRTILDGLSDGLVPGTILLFDEYFNYPGWQQHEHRAFTEYVAAHGTPYRYLAFNQRGQQVAVRIG
jgi:hypothetical protein